MLAWYLLLHNQFSEALRLSEAAVTEAPSSSGAQLVLGRSLTDTGDAKTGLGHLQTALKLDPDNIEVHLALVHVYSELGSKRAAQQERMQVLQMTQNEAGTVARP
jgi:Tfp pilus assembly protein PilF